MMKIRYCILILTYNRAGNIKTLNTLKRAGVSDGCYLVVSDDDPALLEYKKQFVNMVQVFSKEEYRKKTDMCDLSESNRTVLLARNAAFDIAARLGYEYFLELDDDYVGFEIRFNRNSEYKPKLIWANLLAVFDAFFHYYKSINALALCMAQGGDFIGGNSDGKLVPSMRRKAMNVFFLSTSRRFNFVGRLNDDVNTYLTHGARGGLFLTAMPASIVQGETQSNYGGLTEEYLHFGTYAKSFYSVMVAPSCTKVGTLGDPRSPHYRLHHKINWHNAAPKILREHPND
jgi:hypothetical protein